MMVGPPPVAAGSSISAQLTKSFGWGPKYSTVRMSPAGPLSQKSEPPPTALGSSVGGSFNAMAYTCGILPWPRTVPVEVVLHDTASMRHESFGTSGNPRAAQSNTSGLNAVSRPTQVRWRM